VIELFRVNASIYSTGAVLHEASFKYLSSYDVHHSRRLIFPVLPNEELFHIGELGVISVAQPFVHLRITAVGDSRTIPMCDGHFDWLMIENRLDWLLGEDLPRMGNYAVAHCPPLVDGRSYLAWLELWEVDENNIRFIEKTTMKALTKEPG
jgi:hypothetical protein